GRLGGGADLRVVPGGPAEAVPADPAAPVGPGSAEPVDDADRFGGVRHPTGLRRGRVRRADGAGVRLPCAEPGHPTAGCAGTGPTGGGSSPTGRSSTVPAWRPPS